MVDPSLLGQRDKERTCLSKDLHFGINQPNGVGVSVAVDRSHRPDNPDPFFPCCLHGCPGAGKDHTHDGDLGPFLHDVQSDGGDGIARNDDHFDVVLEEYIRILGGVLPHHLCGLRPVRHPRGIAEVYNVLMRQPAGQGVDDGESANPRIKNTYGSLGFHGLFPVILE